MNTRERRLLIAAGCAAAITLPFAAFIAPPDAIQGQAQRFMYLHVPAAWTAYLCFVVVLVCGLRMLFRPGSAARSVARAAAEVGVAMTAFTLITGSIWGALTWGTAWVWDARVTSTVALGLVYLAYLAVDILTPRHRVRWVLAPLAVAGFVMVPVVHFSVVWWRTLHQPATILAPNTSPPIHPMMALTLTFAVVTFTLLAAWILHRRIGALRTGTDRPSGSARPTEVPGDPQPSGVVPRTTTATQERVGGPVS